MTMSPKTLMTIASVSILMAGASAAVAQEAEKTMPAPEEAVASETLETTETPGVEIFTREAVEDAVAENEAAPESTLKVIEETEITTDANKIDASSETVIAAEEMAPETEEAVEEIVQPDE